ncbi:hypothetical protein D3218_04840 [Aureimonas flava]|uniref:Glycosyltransferase family 2 protein n=1 Tax=Aureimonas flava TaxID=2320271 RepID=A0A3A1WMA2_9HYPH|nr:hypothetical protein [Aureimonas flava]RIY02687.1 hypothetical protein D3218_04840 [Aureimonas flava]
MSEPAPRCFLCGGRALAPTQRRLRWPDGFERRFALACGFCGVLTDGEPGGPALGHLAEALVGDRFHLAREAPYGLDIFTLRAAATRWRRAAHPADGAQREALRDPHGDLAAAARLEDLRAGGGPGVAVGLACRARERGDALAALRPHLAWADAIVVLVDGAGADEACEPRVRLAHRPMDGDFASQRNALQDLSPAPWMLQLDADETLAPETGALVPALAGLAEAGGAVSVGLARRNLVDGILADLFPDTQYRLNRREVRFRGTVHERPDRPWQRSLLALHGAIDHHLPRAHVESRSQRYEALAPGRGRLDEAEALLQPFRA